MLGAIISISVVTCAMWGINRQRRRAGDEELSYQDEQNLLGILLPPVAFSLPAIYLWWTVTRARHPLSSLS